MLKRCLLVAAILLPQAAAAADLRSGRTYRHHHAARRASHYVEQNHVIHCTTSDWGMFSSSDCGQGFDPLGIAAY